MAAKKLYNFRFNPDLIARVDRARGHLDRTAWVERAIGEKLAENETMASYECPQPDCDFQAASPAALCAVHGRKVVERTTLPV